MSTQSNDSLMVAVDQGKMKIGNPVVTSTGAVAFSAVTQLSTDASGNLQGTVPVTVVQPTATDAVGTFTGTISGNIMTQTFVAAASTTTATVGGYLRVNIISSQDALFSTSAYYLPVYTLA